MTGINKSLALGYCTGDWCVLMDSDEVYHEEDAEAIRRLPDVVSSDIVGIEFNTLHFYKDYFHLMNGCPDWKDLYNHKVYMVRNGLCIHHGAVNTEPDAHVDLHGKPIDPSKTMLAKIRVFHYGHARSREAYVKKLNHIEGRHSGWKWKPKTVDDFEWISDNKLVDFKGNHPLVMRERLSAGQDHCEIMKLYNYIEGASPDAR
jgi:glycosyltransferase involved in cell wall biosynthesis